MFTKVPEEDMSLLLLQHFDKWTMALIRHVLTTTYFLYSGSFDQRDTASHEMSATPVTVNSLMKSSEQQAINSVAKKPTKQRPQTQEKLAVTAMLPFQPAVSNKTSRLLSKHNIKIMRAFIICTPHHIAY
jgi:hypothetical protein